MASQHKPDPGTGWRPRSLGAPSTVPAPAAATPAWRQLDVSPTTIPPRVRVARLAGVLLLVLTTATALVWLLLWLAPPGPACLVLAGAGYEDNLTIPANPRGREALHRLARLAGTSSPLSGLFQRSGRLRLLRAPEDLRRAGDWDRGLDEAREKTLLVFLLAHGAADGKGAFLLPQDAGPAPEDRLRLGAILDRLATLPASRNKVLFLDATSLTAQWSLGLLENDFARALDQLEDRIAAIPNLVVISSSAADQRSWPAADLRTSLFTRALLEGLADRAAAGPDARLDLWELFQYVAGRVERQAARIHGVVQTPVLLPRSEGEQRARATPMTFRLDASAIAGEPVADPLPDIDAAWAPCDAFRSRAAAARACVPGDWLQWQAWLLRYETLRLAGSPRAAEVLDRAEQAAARVRAGLDLDLNSASATLAMPAVQGEPRLEVPQPYAPFEELWAAAAPDRRTVWQQLRQKQRDETLLRRNLLYALVRRAAENPARYLDQAADLARFLDDPLAPARPEEVQFLVQLQRDLPVRPIPEDLNQALREGLRLRLTAEEAALAVKDKGYAYAERIRPWIAATIAQADHQRQLGQDLLFASDRTRWQEARGYFGKAGELYQRARADAVGLREALAACDRGVAELPILAHWLAEAPVGSEDELLTRTMALFGELRELEQATRAVMAQRDAGKVGAIRKQAQKVQDGLNLLQVRLDRFAQTCESSSSSPLRDAATVLEVPWLDPAVRRRLLQRLGRLAQRARSERETDVTVSPGAIREDALRRGIREGRLALAALGARWFDQTGTVPLLDVEPLVRRPDLEGQGARVLRWAGDQVGERFRQYPVRIDQLVRQASKQQEVAGPLRDADRLSRRLDAGQWQRLATDPPVLARRADVESLLVWQADRAWTDHWYTEDGRTRYYEVVGLSFLRDARRLDPFSRPDAPGAAEVRKRLAAKDGLVVAPSPPRNLIAGDRLRMTAGLTLAAGAPAVEGFPLLWAVPGDHLTFAQPGDADRAVVPAVRGGKESEAPPTPGERLAVTLMSPELARAEQAPPLEATAQQSAVVWQGYYRGLKPTATTPVLLYPVPESTRVEYPRPPQAGIVVQASDSLFARYGEAQGSLVIVFDCSGSEGPAEGARSGPTRFRQATQALRDILARVPRGTRLSLWVFGQAVPPRNTVDPPEDTIRQLRAPAAWDGGDAAVSALAGQVEALRPWNRSPVARAVLRGREDLLKAEGFRDLILISDGDDNRFATDTTANPQKEPIPEVLGRTFAGTNIALHVVGFAGKDGQPEPELVTNFGFVTQRQPAGTISTVTDLKPLLEWMPRTMRVGLRYQLDPLGLERPEGETDPPGWTEVSRVGENDRWVMVSGRRDGYRLRVPLLRLDRRLTLGDGDLMLLRLDGGEPGWRRLLWSRQDPFGLRPARQTGGWRAAVLQDQLLGARALQMLLTVEREDVETEEIREVRPGAVWLEVSPARPAGAGNGQASAPGPLPAVRWGEVTGYPAPAWGIDAPGWPVTVQGPPAPSLKAWWAEPSRRSSLVLSRLEDFASPEELRGEREIGADLCTLEGVTVEEHWVQVGHDRRDRRWCIVVGVSHPPGRPVWATLEGVRGLAGQEHRHFLAPGRYVGLFWFADAPGEAEVRRRLAEDVSAVRFVSVPAFKAEAAAQQQTAAFTDLDTPAPLPPRPRPAWSQP